MSRRPSSNPAAAGAMLLATILLCTGAGLGVGALAGLVVPLALAGLFLGTVAGFAIVYARFRDI